MHDFAAPDDLGGGYAWTATLLGHDYARMFEFYFTLVISRAGAPVHTQQVATFDYSYGDVNCSYTDAEIDANLRHELRRAALDWLAAQAGERGA